MYVATCKHCTSLILIHAQLSNFAVPLVYDPFKSRQRKRFKKDKTRERRAVIAAFELLDEDNSGSLERSEVKEFFEQLGYYGSTIDVMLEILDKDGDGELSTSEVRKFITQELELPLSQSEINSVIEELDASGDGLVSIDEFKQRGGKPLTKDPYIPPEQFTSNMLSNEVGPKTKAYIKTLINSAKNTFSGGPTSNGGDGEGDDDEGTSMTRSNRNATSPMPYGPWSPTTSYDIWGLGI
mgnify:CR=1 FL=1